MNFDTVVLIMTFVKTSKMPQIMFVNKIFYKVSSKDAFIKAVRKIAKQNTKENIKEKFKELILKATKRNNLIAVKWLIRFGNNNNLNRLKDAIRSVLSCACLNNHVEIAKWIYKKCTEKNISLSHVFEYGQCYSTPMFSIACSEGNLEIAQWLRSIGFFEHYKDSFYDACKKGHLNIAMWISTFYIDINYQGAFCIACGNARFDIIRWLILEKNIQRNHYLDKIYVLCKTESSKERNEILNLIFCSFDIGNVITLRGESDSILLIKRILCELCKTDELYLLEFYTLLEKNSSKTHLLEIMCKSGSWVCILKNTFECDKYQVFECYLKILDSMYNYFCLTNNSCLYECLELLRKSNDSFSFKLSVVYEYSSHNKVDNKLNDKVIKNKTYIEHYFNILNCIYDSFYKISKLSHTYSESNKIFDVITNSNCELAKSWLHERYNYAIKK